MRALPALLAGALTALGLAVAPSAGAWPYLPPHGRIFQGVTGLTQVDSFARQTGKHPAIFQFFSGWQGDPGWPFRYVAQARSRPMIALTTNTSTGHAAVSPRGIAKGRGDRYLIGLERAIAASGQITYLRLMAEMDGNWNPYSAYDADGRYRGAGHSTRMFRQAWRRAYVILHGGRVKAMDRELRRLHLPRVRTHARALPRTRVSFMWVPQVAGAPDIPANSPRAYWPGGRWVDWVGTDFYSKFPNFSGLDRFYQSFPHKPFVFGEWALWGSDDPAFVRELFSWIRQHPRVRMVVYNQGNKPHGIFNLSHYPRSATALRHILASPRFPAFAPELEPPHV